MLIGNYQSSLDTKKGRTSFPAKLREELGNELIITAGMEKSLMIVAKKDWKRLAKGIINRPFISSSARETDRFLLGSAFEISLDGNGRFIIPKQLRDYAKLSDEIIFVGVGNRVEVWNKGGWDEHQKYLDENIEKIAQKLDEQKNE